MKYDFSNSTYARLWNGGIEGRIILTQLVNDPQMVRSNPAFWMEKFTVDPNVTPSNADGTAQFISRMRPLQTGNLMSWRAPLAESVPRDKMGVAFYTGTIPDLIADSYAEKATERYYKEQFFTESLGDDGLLLAQYAEEISALLESGHQTLSNMCAQLLSKGKIDINFGRGIKGPVYKADIPGENFKTAGEKAWSDPDCQLLSQMAQIEDDIRNTTGLDIPMVWELPYDMFHDVFLKNSEVIEWVKNYRIVNDRAITENLRVTENMFREAIADYDGLSPISVIQEKQKDQTGIVHGWADGVAVLRPAGPAGAIRHTNVLDQTLYERYGAKTVERVFAKTNDGLFTIMNTTLDNGNLKEWHTDLMMSCVPSLDEFLYHFIIDTTTAD